MSKVNRQILADGEFHEIACAVLKDGKTSPVLELLAQLDAGVWPDPSVDEFPDERQARDRARFFAEIEHLANEGEPLRGYNYLHDGIWELKIGPLRVTFYDTPGDGTFTAKKGRKAEGYWSASSFHFPHDFDRYVRLGHYFAKTGRKTLPADLQRSFDVRQEDLEHDRRAR